MMPRILPEVHVSAAPCRRRKGVREVTVMRASQLDAARLDNELTAMLREQFMRIFSLFQPVSSHPRFAPLLHTVSCCELPNCVFNTGASCACTANVCVSLQRLTTALQPELTLFLDFLVRSTLSTRMTWAVCSPLALIKVVTSVKAGCLCRYSASQCGLADRPLEAPS